MKWARGINNYPLRYSVIGGMQAEYEFFLLSITTPIISFAIFQSLPKRFGIHI